MARNMCRRGILAQQGVHTSVGTGIWAELQLLLPHHTHAILKNHHCGQQGPLVATHTDIHRHTAGEVDTLRLVGATITIVYITPMQMKIMAQCDAHRAPFLSDQHAASSRRTSAHALQRQGATCRGHAQGHLHGVQGFPTPALPTPPERAQGPKQRQHDTGGSHAVS